MITNESLIKTEILKIIERIKQMSKSAKCPACGDIWNRLRECFFYAESANSVRLISDSTCVECAETLKKVEYWLNKYPLTSGFDNWDSIPDMDKNFREPRTYRSVDLLSNITVTISYPIVSKSWLLETKSGGIKMTENGTVITSHGSVPEAWSYIKKRIKDASSEEPKRNKAFVKI
ncbi:MAG: hypothetical protein IPP74_13540 [Alphaproteobacteria bacterium]|nr:hypothetical protein [Alphaproteobacteria bacterium]